MNIFITGVAGFLGSHLAEECIKKGHKVYGNDNLIGGYKDNIPKKVIFSNIDCNNFEKLNDLFKQYKIDVLYHCAATAYEGLSVVSPNCGSSISKLYFTTLRLPILFSGCSSSNFP